MASTFSNLLRLTKQGTGDNDSTWGDLVNTVFELIEDSIAGVATISMGLSDYTLSTANGATDDARCMILNLGGTPGGSRNVIVPNASKMYLVRNTTGFTQTVKTATGSGTTVPNGEVRVVMVFAGVGVIPTTTQNSFTTGMIMAWYGLPANVPSGWQVCDGTNGTPDLRGRFVVGVSADGTTIPLGGTGGASTLSGFTGAGGDHDHSGSTGSHTLTEAQIPAHNHRFLAADNASSSNADGWGVATNMGIPGEDVGPFNMRDANGASTQIIEDTGGGTGHSHTVPTSGTHTHALSSVSSLPPYYGLYWIMRL